jgi:hypothetical protein
LISQDDGELISKAEPSITRIDQLVKLGLAMIGNRDELQFSLEWGTDLLDQWLRETLPQGFKLLDAQDANDGFTWRLLKAKRSQLELHREEPDGYDFDNAKACKSKAWQENKIYLGEYMISSAQLRHLINIA